MWSSNIKITDVTLQNSPFWHLHPYDCTNVTIQGVTILAPVNAPNTDGIDPGKNSIILSIFLYPWKPPKSQTNHKTLFTNQKLELLDIKTLRSWKGML